MEKRTLAKDGLVFVLTAPVPSPPKSPRRSRLLRFVVAFCLLAVLTPVAVLVGVNVFLNVSLPLIINRQPERMKMGWTWAWTWDLHHVDVSGYTLRVQGPVDQWWLSLDRAKLAVDLKPLLERRFQADDVVTWGVSLRYRARADAPPSADGVPYAPYVEGRTAPIPGLSNPPDTRPEDIYPPPEAPWLIAIDDAQLDEIREVWLGDYRFFGDASARADVIVMPDASLDISDAEFAIHGGEVQYEGVPLIGDLMVESAFTLEGVDPVHDAGAAIFGHLDALLEVRARVDDLAIMDQFLGESPWVGVESGYGELASVLDIRQGTFEPGSWVFARAEDLSVGVGTYEAQGEGHVSLDIGERSRATLALVLDRFLIHREGEPTPLVRGRGFRIDATAASVSVDAPPRGLTATALLPRSDVPDLRVFRTYLPADIGIDIQGGKATVSGKATVAEDGDTVSGAFSLDVPSVRLKWKDMPITGAAHIEGRVPTGRLDTGRYDVRGTRFELSRVSVAGKPATWWAKARIDEGRVNAGADIFLVADTTFSCSDSSPFFRVAVGDREVAPWIEGIVTLRDLRGEATLAIGQSSLAVRHMEILTKKSEIHLHLQQTGMKTTALLFARLGILAVATRVVDDEFTVQLFDPRKWFHARLAEAGTPEKMRYRDGRVEAELSEVKDERPGLKIFGADVTKMFGKKTDAELAKAKAERAERDEKAKQEKLDKAAIKAEKRAKRKEKK